MLGPMPVRVVPARPRNRRGVLAVALLLGLLAVTPGGARPSDARPVASTRAAPTPAMPGTRWPPPPMVPANPAPPAPPTVAEPPAVVLPPTLPGLAPAELTAPGHDRVVSRVRTGDPVVFLTVDDGVTKDPAVLDVLGAARVPVTLFLTAGEITGSEPYFRRLQGVGATVQNHTVHHPRLAGLPLAAQQAELCATADRYQRDFGRRPTLVRPPYGELDQNTLAAAGRCGATAVVLWSVVVDRGRTSYAAGARLRPGDIVLLHFTPSLAADLRVVLAQVAAAGLRVGRLEDYLAAPPASGAPPPAP